MHNKIENIQQEEEQDKVIVHSFGPDSFYEWDLDGRDLEWTWDKAFKYDEKARKYVEIPFYKVFTDPDQAHVQQAISEMHAATTVPKGMNCAPNIAKLAIIIKKHLLQVKNSSEATPVLMAAYKFLNRLYLNDQTGGVADATVQLLKIINSKQVKELYASNLEVKQGIIKYLEEFQLNPKPIIKSKPQRAIAKTKLETAKLFNEREDQEKEKQILKEQREKNRATRINRREQIRTSSSFAGLIVASSTAIKLSKQAELPEYIKRVPEVEIIPQTIVPVIVKSAPKTISIAEALAAADFVGAARERRPTRKRKSREIINVDKFGKATESYNAKSLFFSFKSNNAKTLRLAPASDYSDSKEANPDCAKPADKHRI